jgi:2,3-bisphosphoglycerate-independent phosphoglycerate mutase
MIDYSSDEISTAEAEALIETLNEELGSDTIEFHAGISYRHILIIHGGNADVKLTPPHDITGKKVTEYLPSGSGAEILLDIMKKSNEILKNHPVNLDRVKRGLHPANSIWIWGNGTKPDLDLYENKFGLKGAVISAVDLIKGIGKCAGLEVIDDKTVKINPCRVKSIDFASAYYELPLGKVSVSWKRLENGEIDLSYTAPEGVKVIK